MKKKITFILVLLIGLFTVSPIYADNSQNLESANGPQQHINEVLNGFYEERLNAFEIYYGDSSINQRDYFYTQTILMYRSGNYSDILEYLANNQVVIDENHLYGMVIPRSSTRPVNTSRTITYAPNAGFTFTATAKFTGSFTIDGSSITNINVSNTMTYTNSSSGYYTVTFPNKSFTKVPNGLKLKLNLITDVKAKQNVQPYSTITYPSQNFSKEVV